MYKKVMKERFSSFELVEPGVVWTNWQIWVEDPAAVKPDTHDSAKRLANPASSRLATAPAKYQCGLSVWGRKADVAAELDA